MATLPYDISKYQPVLFGAEGIDQVLTEVGAFFSECTDDSINEMLPAAAA